MTYQSSETSKDSGAPIECFEFIGVLNSWYYTSSDESLSLKGRTYLPVPIKRNFVKVQTDTEANSPLEVEVSNDTEIVSAYAFVYVPPNELSLNVYRFHGTSGSNPGDDYILLWSGVVTSVKIGASTTVFTIPNVFSSGMNQDLPNVWFQNSCNHILYDQGCGVNAEAYTTSATVASVNGVSIGVDRTQQGDNALVAGSLQVERTKETRIIIGNTAIAVTVSYPFNDIRTGDVVRLVMGCDHSHSTCLSKFNNAANFGGFPSIPKDNPFEGDIL